eukprot:3687103-Lingulodinium_polyedra.AAC.1
MPCITSWLARGLGCGQSAMDGSGKLTGSESARAPRTVQNLATPSRYGINRGPRPGPSRCS